jgi:NAD(P)-dependent dehydrogenase (short-subunit alcohol dehydrogenase family)
MKVAVVTGGASGIGEAAARRFGREGQFVVIADVQAERGRRVADDILAKGAECDFYAVDVANEVAVFDFARAILERHGQVHSIVNAAGLLQNAIRAVDLPMEEFDRLWSVNVRGAFVVSKAFGGSMCAAGGGSIVNLCSLTSFRPSPQPAYAIGKAALHMLTEVLAAEFGPFGVRVNAVAPGYTLTAQLKDRIDRGLRDQATMISKSALRRLVQPEEVADAIFFLCSEQATAISGATLPVDCGWLAYSAYSSYASQPPH